MALSNGREIAPFNDDLNAQARIETIAGSTDDAHSKDLLEECVEYTFKDILEDESHFEDLPSGAAIRRRHLPKPPGVFSLEG